MSVAAPPPSTPVRRRTSPSPPTTLSLTELSRATGISLSHLSRIMKGTRRPSVTTLAKLADVLQVSMDQVHRTLDAARTSQEASCR